MHPCPECGSDRTQRLEMAHATLTATLAGAMTAPPAVRSSTGAGIAMTVGLVLLALALLALMGGAGEGALILVIPGATIFVLAAVRLSESNRYNTEKLPALLAQWRLKWVCLTCGAIFVPPAPSGPETAVPAEPTGTASAASGRASA